MKNVIRIPRDSKWLKQSMQRGIIDISAGIPEIMNENAYAYRSIVHTGIAQASSFNLPAVLTKTKTASSHIVLSSMILECTSI